MRHSRPADAGFTLLETLIALTVVTLLASVLLRGVVAARADAAWFDDHTARTRLATALLDEAVGNRRLRDGIYRGDRDGRRWMLTAVSIDEPAPAPATGTAASPVPLWRPQRLSVKVEAANRAVVLETVRLAAPP